MGNIGATSKNKDFTYGWIIQGIQGTNQYVTNFKHSCAGIYETFYIDVPGGCGPLAGKVKIQSNQYQCSNPLSWCNGNKKENTTVTCKGFNPGNTPTFTQPPFFKLNNNNRILFSYFQNLAGTPMIKYDIETFLFNRKKKKEIDVEFTPTQFYQKKIVLNDIDNYNLKSIITHNCFMFYSGGIGLYTNLPANNLIKLITPYNKKYGDTWVNVSNLFSTLISLELINKIENDCDFNYKNNNSFYLAINQIKLRIVTKIFKNDNTVKNNFQTLTKVNDIMFNHTYIQYLFYSGNDDDLLSIKYFVSYVIKIEIKAFFLFNYIFKINSEYFNENNMDKFYEYLSEYFLSNHTKTNDIINNLEKYMDKSIEYTKKCELTITINSWFKYIDLTNSTQYLFLISDAPKVFTNEDLMDKTINKTKYLKKYFDMERASYADDLVYNSPWSFINSPYSESQQSLRRAIYLRSVKYFNQFKSEEIITTNNNENCNCNNDVINRYLDVNSNNIVIFNDSKYYLIPNYYAKFLNKINNSDYWISDIYVNNYLIQFIKDDTDESIYRYTYKSILSKNKINLMIKSKKNTYVLIQVTTNENINKYFIRTNKNKLLDISIDKSSTKNNIMIYDIFSKITYSIDFTSLL